MESVRNMFPSSFQASTWNRIDHPALQPGLRLLSLTCEPYANMKTRGMPSGTRTSTKGRRGAGAYVAGWISWA
jgi:hypothetical protein